MSKFTLSERSLGNLEGVHWALNEMVKLAIQITRHDFTVIEGVRTPERQRRLFQRGATTTLNSRHLTGHAVDLAPYCDEHGIEWDWPSFFPIADAMIEASRALDLPLRWGAAWNVRDYRDDPTMDARAAHDCYLSQRERPFLDGPHFELPRGIEVRPRGDEKEASA